MISGRADFVLADSIHECKATFDPRVVNSALVGKPKPEHLAQLTCYLLEFQLTRGLLVYGFYKQRKDGTFKRDTVATIEVTIEGDLILTNGYESGHKVSELVNTLIQAAKYLNSDHPAPRPSTAKNKFGSPCMYCPVKDLCDRIDSENLTINESRAEAKTLIEGAKGPTPKPGRVKE